MDAYERSIIRGIYQAACMGDRRAMRILENLTTKRRRLGKCQRCGATIKKNSRKYCSQHCANLVPRTNPGTGPKPSLTLEQIASVRAEFVRGTHGKAGNQSELAKKYGVSTFAIVYWAVEKLKPKQAKIKTALLC